MNGQDFILDYRYLTLDFEATMRDEDQLIIFNFFIVFSRFEYSLKEYKTYRNVNGNGNVSANWDRFASKHKEKFDYHKSKTLHQAVTYYLTYPPDKQIEENGHLGWKKNTRNPGESDFTWVLRSVRYARNNLFHGGKFPYDQLRDTTLLYYGLVILYEALDLNKIIKRTFMDSPDTIEII
jgi:hypothetical protein